VSEFAERIVAWQKHAGRHDLPWQRTRDPYRIWLSEIMLQQTRVGAVIAYFERFVARFPDLAALARADEDEVLRAWSGLGYYARARNLHRAACRIVAEHGGAFPSRFEDIRALPGVGRSTAGAIAVFAFGARHPILDGNVKRVFARCFGMEGYPGAKPVEAAMWAHAQNLLPQTALEAYIQGLMDLGATICTRSGPRCEQCPLRNDCVARRERRVASLPTARPRKPLPHRATTMLVLVDGLEVLLEKRPPQGIWGGLWCLPEIGAHETPAQVALTRFGATVEAQEALPVVAHGFTHFSLDIAPLLCRVRRADCAQSPGRAWLALDDALGAALPAPVRRILGGVRKKDSAGLEQRG